MSGTGALPRILPAKPRGFVNRDAELTTLKAGIEHARSAGEQGVFVLTGLPGVGKTTLAAQCAHLVKESFPDGWLCATLGASADALTVEEALTIFLPLLGVETLPPTGQGLRLTFQSVTADKALLLVLDDVESAAQLTNLLPASTRSVVLATSRRRSEGFARERFTVLNIPEFTVDSAVEMIRADIGATRAAEQDADVRLLAKVCGYLPLALSVACAQVNMRYHGQAGPYVARLRSADSPVAELTIEGERPVEAIFEISYRDLTDEQRRVYRLLSVHPGVRFSSGVVATLLDVSVDEVSARLAPLVTANLLTDLGGGRYEFHGLLREHAAALAAEEEHPADCRRALDRVVRWYLEFAVAREQVLARRARFGELFDGRIAPAYVGEDAWDRAVADLERERPNLRRAVQAAVDEGLDDVAWQLCEALFTFFFQRDLCADAIAVHTGGVVAAQRLGEVAPRLRTLAMLGAAYFSAEDNASASRFFDEASLLAQKVPEDSEAVLMTTSSMFEWKAFVHQRRDEIPDAVEAVERARVLAEAPRFPEAQRARALALLDMNGAPMLAKAGRVGEAVESGRRAREYFAGAGEPQNLAKSLGNLGECLATAGRMDEAEPLLREAAELSHQLGMLSWEAHVATVLAGVLEGADRAEEATVWSTRASELFTQLGDQRAEALRGRG